MYFKGETAQSGTLVHYNGKRFATFNIPYPSDVLGGIYAIKDLAVSVGFANNKAYVTKL